MKHLPLFLFSAGVLLSVESAENTLLPEKPWVSDGNGEYTIHYTGSARPALKLPLNTEPGHFLRIRLESRSDSGTPTCFMVFDRSDGKRIHLRLRPTRNWEAQTFWLFTGAADSAALRWNPDPNGGAGTIRIRKIIVDRFAAPRDAGNLIPDGNFESGNETPLFWRVHLKGGEAPRLANSGEFLCGERSLVFSSKPGNTLISGALPVTPGRKYRLIFWAKGENATGLRTAFSLWSPAGHRGDHFHTGSLLRIGTEWKRYELTIGIPADSKRYPDLDERIGALTFAAEKNALPANVLLDEFSFEEIK